MANGRMFMFASKYMGKGKQNEKKTKSSFTSKSLSQREQIVQQTLTGFCLFSSMCNLWLFSFSTSHSLSLQLLT